MKEQKEKLKKTKTKNTKTKTTNMDTSICKQYTFFDS